MEPAVTANVYAVHLKSNYGANNQEKRDLNRAKRTHSIAQILEQERLRRGRKAPPVIVAGDMNADKWGKDFAGERIFADIEAAGFKDLLELLPPESRGTHPSARYGDSALDYIFVRGLDGRTPPRIIPNDGLSDHRALFVMLD